MTTPQKTKILVLGAYGLLGSYLCPYLESNYFKVFKQGRKDSAEYKAIPTNIEEMKILLRNINPDFIVNLNALTRLDICEASPSEAYQANVKTVEVLLEAIKVCNSSLIHISTDGVYEGKGPHPEANVNLINVYGSTKYKADILVSNFGGTVLRTNFLGKSWQKGRPSFTDWLVNAMRREEELYLPDVRFNAVHQSFLSNIIELCFHKKTKGIFNISCEGSITKKEFAIELAKRIGINNFKYKFVSSDEIGRIARRPKDMSLDILKAKNYFKIEFPTIEDTLNLVKLDYLKFNK